MSVLRSGFKRVADAIKARPIPAAAITGFLSGSIGDGAAQMYGDAPFDTRRWLGVATYSTFSSVFLYLPFYRALDARFGVAVTLQSVAAKVVLDDLLFVPGVEIPSFFVWSGTVEGKNVRELFERDYLATLIAGLWFNIPVTILNFTVVPPHLRVLVVDVAEMAWCGILSHFSHRSDTVLPGPDAVPPVVVSPNFIRAPQPRAPQPRAQCKDPDARRPS